MSWLESLGSLVRRYVKNEDIHEREKEVMTTLADGKEREAEALGRAARATGDEGLLRRARGAEEEAKRLRRRLADDVALDVLSGHRR